MLKDITIGQYYQANSIIHRLDPRTKIAASMVYIIAMFIANTVVGYLLTFALFLVAVSLSSVPARKLLAGIKPLWFIILFTFIVNLFFGVDKENALFAWGPLAVTKIGIISAIALSVRLILLIMGTSILTLTTSPIQLTDGIESLLSPLKAIGFPAHEIAMMMTIALRFIPTLLEETDKIMKAQMARGADFTSGGLITRAKGIIPLLVPLFVSSFRRAEELAMAMESRCYRGGKGRTRMKEMSFATPDYVSWGIMAAYTAGVFVDRFVLAGILGFAKLV
ncbi:MAG TPA: energy-coupling factor transporter transmembrane component T [Clostridia bacterium]|nr:energy-coupling factor transporter transmembrane component T [Clostridia bacterium]